MRPVWAMTASGKGGSGAGTGERLNCSSISLYLKNKAGNNYMERNLGFVSSGFPFTLHTYTLWLF